MVCVKIVSAKGCIAKGSLKTKASSFQPHVYGHLQVPWAVVQFSSAQDYLGRENHLPDFSLAEKSVGFQSSCEV